MKNIVKAVGMEEAKSLIPGFAYGLLYKTEGIDLIRISEADGADDLLTDCYEARFFDDERELRIFIENGDEMAAKAGIIQEPVGEDCVSQDKEYYLANKYKGIGNLVVVREYLMPDVDGQMCVKMTRLVRIEV